MRTEAATSPTATTPWRRAVCTRGRGNGAAGVLPAAPWASTTPASSLARQRHTLALGNARLVSPGSPVTNQHALATASSTGRRPRERTVDPDHRHEQAQNAELLSPCAGTTSTRSSPPSLHDVPGTFTPDVAIFELAVEAVDLTQSPVQTCCWTTVGCASATYPRPSCTAVTEHRNSQYAQLIAHREAPATAQLTLTPTPRRPPERRSSTEVSHRALESAAPGLRSADAAVAR